MSPKGTTERKDHAVAHSFVACNIHYVFSTKNRANAIFTDMRQRLWSFIGGIARHNGILARAVGGTDNHVHILASIPATMPVAKAVQLIKGGSSKWVHETFRNASDFAWQEGYGAFSVSASGLSAAAEYIARQDQHHRNRSFEEEYVELLRKHGIEFEEQYIFG